MRSVDDTVTSGGASSDRSGSLLGLLLRTKMRALRNRFVQAVHHAPVRLSATVILMGVVWVGLFVLFWLVFHQFQRTPLEATVAIPLVFNFFFMAMLFLLAFSNATIVYAALFSKQESAYLASAPPAPLDIVTLKYVESLMVSSWSLVLLGVPLMVAMAWQAQGPVFYLLFIAFFVAFIPIPGSIGLLLAWAAARFFPRRLIRPLVVVAGVFLTAAFLWGMRFLRLGDMVTEDWLREFLAKMSFVESALLPNHWVAEGIDHALEGRFYESGMYLFVTFANALFLSWVVVRLVSAKFATAYDRASVGLQGVRRMQGSSSAPGSTNGAGWSRALFFYLDPPLRLIATKDLRTFLREPLQWSQLLILFGLLILYLSNMPTLLSQLASPRWALIAPFLNLCAISLILATFTCRFVFPLVSLEGRNLWMIGLLPIARGRVLHAKFAFAMTVTLAASIGSMLLGIFALKLSATWAVIHLVVTFGICFGLCGFAIGIGARLPMFSEPNTARIVSGVGGTTNLLASLALVAIVLTCVGMATFGAASNATATAWPDVRWSAAPNTAVLAWCALGVGFSVIAGILALVLGARHFQRVEI